MADKEVKIIHNAVRIDINKDRGDGRLSHIARVYGPGDEDDLAKDLPKEEVQRLTDQGAIEGFGATKAEPEAPKEEAPAAAPAAAPKAPAPPAA